MAAPLAVHPGVSFHSQALMLRGRACLTQRELAAAIGVSERAIQVWEGGLGYPSAPSLQRLTALYIRRRAFTAGHEVEEASAFWESAVAEAPRLKTAFDTQWFASLMAGLDGASVAELDRGAAKEPTPRHDWGEAPAVSVFHGRASEQQILTRWLLTEKCRLVGIVGIGGMGKTALAARVAELLAPRFDAVFWRSLRNAPSCSSWLADAILFLSEQRGVPPEGEQARHLRLLELLRERRCLLVLDNLEAVLEPGVYQPRYRDGYADYGTLLQSVGEASHQSCLLLTSREEPSELARLQGPRASVRSLRLGGLDEDAGHALLEDKGLVGNAGTWGTLVRRYSGNALALQVVGELIARVFSGDIAAFLSAGEAVFGDIRLLLQAQVARLSATERAVLYWLAIERDPIDFETLVDDLGPGTPRHEVLDALQALDRRSLLERGEDGATFTLQPVVLEHATDEVISICQVEISRGEPSMLVTHTLVKAQAKEYVRHHQERLIAGALLDRMAASLPKKRIEQLLMDLLERWRGPPTMTQALEHRFGPGNVVNLLGLSRGNLRGLDLSRLVLRQTNFSSDAQDVQLAHSHLQDALLAQQFGDAVSTDLSADGTHLAVGTTAGEVQLWRLADHAPVLVEKQSIGPVWDIALSADGQTLATCSSRGAVCVWRTDGLRSPTLLNSDTSEVWSIALSADGRFLAGGAGDGTARLWDTHTGSVRAFECNHGRVRGVALSGDGQILATGGADGVVAVWDVTRRAPLIHKRNYPGEASGIALSADGRLIVNGDAEGCVYVRDSRTGEPQAILRGHTGPVWAVAMTPNGALVASGGSDRTVRLWDPRSGECQRVLYEHTAGVVMTSLSADGRLVASVSLDGSVRVWESQRGRCVAVSQGNVPAVHGVALSADHRRAVSGGGDGSVRVWDTVSGKCLRVLRGHNEPVWAIAVSPDGGLAVSSGMDGTVRVWDVPTGECRFILSGHTLGVASVALSPDRRLIASGSFDGTLRLWDADNGQCLRVQPCHGLSVQAVAFSDDGCTLIAGELSGTVRTWDTRSGDCLQEMNNGTGDLRGLAASADGGIVVSAGPGGEVRVWDARTGECLRRIQAQNDGIRALALSPDGKIMAIGGVDGTVQVWDVNTAELRDVLQGHQAEVWGVALSGDDHLLVSGSLDGTVRLWDIRGHGKQLRMMRPDRPYERMDITGTTGITDVQRTTLIALGAVDAAP